MTRERKDRKMKQTYTIKVTCDNPEFGSETLKDGRKADGFLLLASEGGEPDFAALSGLSVSDLVDFFLKDDMVISLLRQAAVIGEAKRTAMKIRAEMKDADRRKDMMIRSIQEVLGEIGEQDREREE